jgi:beta-glucanase (GH16 family)
MNRKTKALLLVALVCAAAAVMAIAVCSPNLIAPAMATARTAQDNEQRMKGMTAQARLPPTPPGAAAATPTTVPSAAELTATPTAAASSPSTTSPMGVTTATLASAPTVMPLSDHGALLFSDEFNGTSVDTTKWVHIKNSDITGHAASWNPAACAVSGGSLHVTAQFIGGKLSSCGLWTQGIHEIPPYGYWEMRARIPANSGTWPAFWSLAYNRKADPSLEVWEIDTMEAIDHAPADQQAISWNLHIRTASGGDDNRGYSALGAEMYSGYHTYATSWSPGLLVWYVDGVERFRVADRNVPSMSQIAIVQMALGSLSGPLDTSQLPLTMDVDWIRIYANP